ncbi:MAG: PSD1 and planctomycete cytochrome C domain-containing protein [Fuerstiella sp.]|nr:PSD1 and planctomycete cytochrome C domain-containing protein [Fuerstiella sp.]
MLIHHSLQFRVCVLCVLMLNAVRVHSADISFSQDIQPILAKRCFACHGPAEQKAGLTFHDRSLAIAETESGAVAIVPGEPESSALVHRVSSHDESIRMPPEGDPLSTKEIGMLTEWIAGGAEFAPHWGFVKPQRAVPPEVDHPNLVHNPIDQFVQARMNAIGLMPAPPASRAKLIRRLYLDLTGLLPPVEAVNAFKNGEIRYSDIVEELLESKHFGERWGRHWLDLARYADTFGYERDDVRPNAWRFRDWVVQSFNSNQPVDQFLIEQLAGDLLEDPTPDQYIAAGLHRMNIKNNESGINKEDYRNREMVDRVNTTSTSMLGITFGCCQCHSHKYDPFSQSDYYSLYAFFNNVEARDTEIQGTQAEQERYERAQSDLDAHRKQLDARKKLLAEMRGHKSFLAWRGDDSNKTDRAVSLLQISGAVSDALRQPENNAEVVAAFWMSLQERADDTKKELKQLGVQRRHLPKPGIMTLAETTENRRPTHVLVRGDFKQKGEEVRARPPGFLSPFIPRGNSPDRLDLARWITSRQNPLTARVAVNHIWAHLFARGIVSSVDDFGTQGEPPTHPKLLDWLAVEFMESGWNRKHIIRTIVDSATYQQSSRVVVSKNLNHQPALGADNPLFARQSRFRVESEIVRDLFLDACGLLHREIGGPTVHPMMPSAVSDLAYKYKTRWKLSEKPQRYRRGIYIHFKRTNPYPTLLMFDGPESNVCQAMRTRSNTPLQALATLNDPVFVECAQALGHTLARKQAGDESRLEFLLKQCLARTPETRELDALLQLLRLERNWFRSNPKEAKQLVGEYSADPIEDYEAAAWTVAARTVLNLDEFVTRE